VLHAARKNPRAIIAALQIAQGGISFSKLLEPKPGNITIDLWKSKLLGGFDSGLLEYLKFSARLTQGQSNGLETRLKLLPVLLHPGKLFREKVRVFYGAAELDRRTVISEATLVARLRCARAVIAVERYRLAHGKLPESLDILAPAFLASVPVDPFSGKKMIYVCLKSGFAVCSVGKDGVDDREVFRMRKDQFNAFDDIVVRVTR